MSRRDSWRSARVLGRTGMSHSVEEGTLLLGQ
jgi:hypothetical protein